VAVRLPETWPLRPAHLFGKLRLAGGFAVEPYEYVDLFEQFGGVLESPHPE
jgi:hypothetical protein